jgi:hypothetical protein
MILAILVAFFEQVSAERNVYITIMLLPFYVWHDAAEC